MDKDSKLTATTSGEAKESLKKLDETKTVEVQVKSENQQVEEKTVTLKADAKKEVKADALKEEIVIDKKAVEEIKETPKKATPKAKAEKTAKAKPVAKKEVAKRQTKKKESSSKKSTVASKIKVSTYIQYFGKEIEHGKIIERVKENWINQGNDAKNIKNLELYVKPEEGAVYYVVNGVPNSGKIEF